MAEVNDHIQHGIDNDPNNDAEKGAKLGGIGGAVTGAIAGSMAGPVGTVIGAVVGGLSGAGLSGAAVAAVDRVDNDNTVSGIGDGVNYDDNRTAIDPTLTDSNYRDPSRPAGAYANDLAYDNKDRNMSDVEQSVGANGIPGTQTGGHAVDGTMDTRGVWEKAADTLTGDHTDDKTGKTVDKNPIVDANSPR